MRIGPLCLVIGALIFALSGCGGEDHAVPNDLLESARLQAIENAKYNAQKFKSEYYPSWVIYSRGDSSQKPTCPQGDGWASVDLMPPDGQSGEKIELKCSTYSAATGCWKKKDFEARQDLNGQEHVCSSTVPYPLPNIKG